MPSSVTWLLLRSRLCTYVKSASCPQALTLIAYTSPIAINPHIDIFFFKGNWIFHMIAMGSREQITSVTIEQPGGVSVEIGIRLGGLLPAWT